MFLIPRFFKEFCGIFPWVYTLTKTLPVCATLFAMQHDLWAYIPLLILAIRILRKVFERVGGLSKH